MANSGPDTNKSQFFITYSKQSHLEGKYTIFGKYERGPFLALSTLAHCGFMCRVIDGADTTLETMEKMPVNEKNRPTEEIKLISVSTSTGGLTAISMLIFDFRLRFMPTQSPLRSHDEDITDGSSLPEVPLLPTNPNKVPANSITTPLRRRTSSSGNRIGRGKPE